VVGQPEHRDHLLRKCLVNAVTGQVAVTPQKSASRTRSPFLDHVRKQVADIVSGKRLHSGEGSPISSD
jgi:hypothetical protein